MEHQECQPISRGFGLLTVRAIAEDAISGGRSEQHFLRGAVRWRRLRRGSEEAAGQNEFAKDQGEFIFPAASSDQAGLRE